MTLDFSSWTCPLPLRDYPKIVFKNGEENCEIFHRFVSFYEKLKRIFIDFTN